MKAYGAARMGASGRLFGALVLVAGLGLAGCSDVDNALFGSAEDNAAPAASTTPGTLPSGDQAAAQTSPARAVAPAQQQYAGPQYADSAPQGEAGTLGEPASAAAPMSVGTNLSAFTPVPIEPGSDAGTAVSKTIGSLRAQVAGIQDRVAQNAQRLGYLHGQAAQQATAYHESKARITARLQVGTTRGNPELVAEWNTAQSSLDQLTISINAMNALGTDVANDSSSTHYVLDQIAATFNVSGAVDEDHRQLRVLEDETNQIVILIDRLLTEVSADVQRQTAYAANERANLTTLAGAIKNGELYGSTFGSPMMVASSAPGAANAAYGGTPLVVIRFDHPNVDYQQILYAALSQALQTRPGAGFSVVAVSPTRGTVTAVQLAQTAAKRHAQEVMRSITDMGVPASRLAVASSTDPGATASEVRVFVR